MINMIVDHYDIKTFAEVMAAYHALPFHPAPVAAPCPPRHHNAQAHSEERAIHKPFDRSQPVHNLGKMDVKCEHCCALHWMDEHISKSSKQSPKFGMCCFSGKIKLPKLENPPPELMEFLTGMNDASKKFQENIW